MTTNRPFWADPQKLNDAIAALQRITGKYGARTPVSGTGGQTAKPAPRVASAAIVERLLVLVGDGRALQILSVAKDKAKSVDNRMLAIVKIDSRFEGFNSRLWAELLDVTPAAIRKACFWKSRKTRKE
jgi:hypothetical protein